ncbi:unnamed protein product [Urochloa humidicola]
MTSSSAVRPPYPRISCRKPMVLRGDARLAMDYEELVGYGYDQSHRGMLKTIDEVVAVAAAGAADPCRSAGTAALCRLQTLHKFLSCRSETHRHA